jgi:hypothetical protein
VLLSGLTPPVVYYPGRFRLVAGHARDNPVYRAPAERDDALRRKSAARTRARNCSGVSGGGRGQGPASPRPAPRASQLFSRSYVPQGSPAAWLRGPSLRVNDFGRRAVKGRCVGHRKVQPDSRPPPFSSGQARRAYHLGIQKGGDKNSLGIYRARGRPNQVFAGARSESKVSIRAARTWRRRETAFLYLVKT